MDEMRAEASVNHVKLAAWVRHVVSLELESRAQEFKVVSHACCICPRGSIL